MVFIVLMSIFVAEANAKRKPDVIEQDLQDSRASKRPDPALKSKEIIHSVGIQKPDISQKTKYSATVQRRASTQGMRSMDTQRRSGTFHVNQVSMNGMPTVPQPKKPIDKKIQALFPFTQGPNSDTMMDIKSSDDEGLHD